MKKILIAIDDGPTAEKVAAAGLDFGKHLHAELALLSVVNSAALMTDGAVTPQELSEVMINDFRKNHLLLIDKVFKANKIFTFVEVGKLPETIIKVASEWDADVIVIGTHGRTGMSHLVLGSVAEKVIRHSAKPVLVIPTK